jgi:hypothetical protein
MSPWKSALREAAVSGAVASVFSAATLAWAGRRQTGAPAAPLNATSHWLWGDAALRRDRLTARHTAVGYLIHHAAATFWAALHARALGARPQAAQPLPALAAAAVTASAACFVDLRLTPHRLTPGFEHRLSPRALTGVYAAFAIGLAVGSLAMRHRR